MAFDRTPVSGDGTWFVKQKVCSTVISNVKAVNVAGSSYRGGIGGMRDFLEIMEQSMPEEERVRPTEADRCMMRIAQHAYWEEDERKELDYLEARIKRSGKLCWVPVHIMVRSQLMEGTNCQGITKATVFHAQLQEDIRDGRLARKKGEVLCRPRLSWKSLGTSLDFWDSIPDYGITCRRCIALIARHGQAWKLSDGITTVAGI